MRTPHQRMVERHGQQLGHEAARATEGNSPCGRPRRSLSPDSPITVESPIDSPVTVEPPLDSSVTAEPPLDSPTTSIELLLAGSESRIEGEKSRARSVEEKWMGNGDSPWQKLAR
jgi:hypothetical protein